MDTPVWVSYAVVLALHGEQLAEHGGADGLRDEGLLESSLARPQNIFGHDTPDLATLAAAYGFGLAKNHPFVDGNKRASFVVTELFLVLNGYELTVSDEEIVKQWFDLAAGKVSEADLASWIRTRLIALDE